MTTTESLASLSIVDGQWVRYHGSQTLLNGFVYRAEITPTGRLLLTSDVACLADLYNVRASSVTPLRTTTA